MLRFIVLTYTLGPMAAISYGLHVLSMTPIEIFFFLSVLNILPIPFLFKLFELGGRRRRLYRMKILRKFSKVTNKRLEDLMEKGDKITELFKERLGHLGFYMSIILFTFIFGVLWASLLSHILLVKRKRAFFCISVAVVLGNLFWLFITEYSRDLITPVGVIAISVAIPLLVYGSRREVAVIREITALLDVGESEPDRLSLQR